MKSKAIVKIGQVFSIDLELENALKMKDVVRIFVSFECPTSKSRAAEAADNQLQAS